ncbi:hypothetical protein Pla52n_55940 [Stieleria varia]|uniref:Uncharacterized protein n=1 Tax=Stieleria varia TaxID=2528005 RepID=A0A5C6A2Y9_9BACT|nr:hypothetical protein Pla52n_55940 [Stieleria varia]
MLSESFLIDVSNAPDNTMFRDRINRLLALAVLHLARVMKSNLHFPTM